LTQRSCRVLVVDDEPALREVLQARLEQWGFPVRTASTVELGKTLLTSFDPHVVISDLVLPDATGISFLEHIRAQSRSRIVLLITAYGTIDTAVQAIKAGAAEFLTKPLDYVALRRQLEEVDKRIQKDGGAVPRDDSVVLAAAPDETFFGMAGKSAALNTMQEQLRVAAASDAPVLIVGESGSGKELVARTIHALSRRNSKAFVPVNAAAIPESLAEAELFGAERGAFTGATHARAGLFEEAHTGTLFLDEVTEMPMSLQPKLLRVLEDGSVRRVGGRSEMVCDVRLIAATNRDPLQAVNDGRLRQDLLYRLDVLRVDVPPLRDRKEDIPALVSHFLHQHAQAEGVAPLGVTREALDSLTTHDWPGNIRELRNWVARAVARARGDNAKEIGPAHTALAPPPSLDGAQAARLGIVIPHGVTVAEAERILIMETLRSTGNNKAEAARRLGLDVKTIRNKLKLFDPGGSDE
jgi:two-component system response regulator HydG